MRRWSISLALVLAGVAACLGAVLFWFDPAQYGFYPHCLFYQTTGLLCPGCGGLRAAHQLLHGHWLAALRFNALLVVGLPFLIALGLQWGWRASRGKPLRIPARPLWWWMLLVVLAVFGVWRNWPGSFLAMGPG